MINFNHHASLYKEIGGELRIELEILSKIQNKTLSLDLFLDNLILFLIFLLKNICIRLISIDKIEPA
ncbi:MAG: hypothetical protein CK427_13000 [Leptospira sp.]|nr:MAG: hypothetical protein CK427_13000 [Leptospira sp.]